MAEATIPALRWLDGFAAHRKFRRPRRARVVIPTCILLICGCFAATALLQMARDRAHALAQAERFGGVRATDAAQAAARILDGYVRLGQVFADGPQLFRSADLGRAAPGLRDIIVWDTDHRQAARLQADAQTAASPTFAGPRALTDGGLAFRDRDRIIEVRFDTRGLAPQGVMLSPLPGPAAVPGWPLHATVMIDRDGALAGWTGALPLYLFVILGPAAAGAWLAVLLVGAFERQARAGCAVRALKSTRPVEARLMVRLAHAERGAAQALRAKSEFIAHMSHELRTPLNAVIGFSEVIAQGYFGAHPKYGEYARDIHAAGLGLHGKIGDILEFANIEAGHFPLKPEPVELAALVSACLDEHQGRAFSRRIRLSLGLAEPGLVRADPLAVRRILSNLIVNALTYTAENGRVRADIRFADGAGIVTLADSGKGFTAAERDRAGQPFARFDRPGAVTGAGLGLAIAMELARRMGGAMRLAGGPGQGAVLEVRLPRL